MFKSAAIGAVAGATLLLGFASTARATFMIDPAPGGPADEMFFAGDANKDVTSFVGNVGSQGSGPMVTVTTIGAVDTDAGYGEIKPIKNGTLTSVVFTPANSGLFSDFSFRGQLSSDGVVDVIVTDSLGNAQTFMTPIEKGNADFDRFGIISDDGETIKSVALSFTDGDSFKSVKQIDFSPVSIPEPTTLGLLAAGLFGLGYIRRRVRS